MILAGDIGGTRARFALFGPDGKRVLRQEVYESRSFANVDAVIRHFLGARPPKISSACIGIAGPVINQRCSATNLPWVVDARGLSRRFKIKRVTLINDLVALALGAVTAPRSKLRSLSGGTLPVKKGANVAILAAGTGLGEAILVWDGLRFVPLATEGGHTDFAPRTPVEAELLSFLRERLGRATTERVLSGPGLGHLYRFFVEARGLSESKDNAARLAEADDANAEITRLGLAKKSAPAAATLELFTTLYGAEAGNLALRSFALGGIFVAGNIASQLLPLLEQGEFLRSFRAKDPMGALVERIPVAVVLDSSIGLAGAAYYALHPAG